MLLLTKIFCIALIAHTFTPPPPPPTNSQTQDPSPVSTLESGVSPWDPLTCIITPRAPASDPQHLAGGRGGGGGSGGRAVQRGSTCGSTGRYARCLAQLPCQDAASDVFTTSTGIVIGAHSASKRSDRQVEHEVLYVPWLLVRLCACIAFTAVMKALVPCLFDY